MSDLFVSYKREDARRASALVEALRSAGFATFWDQDIPPGSNWQISLERALDAARLCVVIWSKHSVGAEGHFVREEARRAALRGAYLGLLVDAVLPPLGFGEWQAFDADGWDGTADHPVLDSLVRHIRARLGSGPAAQPPVRTSPPSAPRPGRRRNLRLAVAALALTAALAAGVLAFGQMRASRCQSEQNALVAQLRRTANAASLRNGDLIRELEADKGDAVDPAAIRRWWIGEPASASATPERLPLLLARIFTPANGLEVADEDGRFMPFPAIDEVIDREGGERKDGLLRLFGAGATARSLPDLGGSTPDALLAELHWLAERIELYTRPEQLRRAGGCGPWSSLAGPG